MKTVLSCYVVLFLLKQRIFILLHCIDPLFLYIKRTLKNICEMNNMHLKRYSKSELKYTKVLNRMPHNRIMNTDSQISEK